MAKKDKWPESEKDEYKEDHAQVADPGSYHTEHDAPHPEPAQHYSTEELAAQVREHINLEYHTMVDPDQQHLHRTAVEVTNHLGMEPNALNVTHVMEVIKNHVTPPSREYPKMRYHYSEHDKPPESGDHDMHYDPVLGAWMTVVHSADEEKALGHGWSDHKAKDHDHDKEEGKPWHA